MKKISVVIGTYNQAETLKTVLDSLTRQTLFVEDFEVIVVDSSSSDNTEDIVRDFAIRYYRVYNRGKSAARNYGIKQAQGEIVLLTDADMLADPHLLEEHLKAHEQNQNICVEGLTLNMVRLIPPDIITPQNPHLTPYIKENIKPGQSLKWAYFLSGNLSVRKETIIKAGLFDEKFSGYGWEDLELGYRLSKTGVPLIYLPTAINYHYHLVDRKDMLKRKYNMGKSAAYFYQKHRNFEVKMFLGLNPLAMGIFYLLKAFPPLRKLIRNQYLLEEYHYRLGLTEELTKRIANSHR